jgi:hypothetical protein
MSQKLAIAIGVGALAYLVAFAYVVSHFIAKFW